MLSKFALCNPVKKVGVVNGLARRFTASGPGWVIIDTSSDVMVSQPPTSAKGMKPSQIVSELNKHIVGQDAAKKALAIAMRNRYRRKLLPKDLQQEVVPKNILLIGPTGVGKTELARRMATLADAPFIKVEATRYTEVGFHGKDVDTIIRELVDMSVLRAKDKLKAAKRNNQDVRARANEKIAEALQSLFAQPRGVLAHRVECGELDEIMIEIDVPIKPRQGFPFANMFGPGSPFENMANNPFASAPGGAASPLETAFNNLFSRGAQQQQQSGGASDSAAAKLPTEKQRVSVKEAKEMLVDAEIEGDLNQQDIIQHAIKSAEEDGIVFIDEIDKICTSKDAHRTTGDASSEGVQRDLLPLIEGSTIQTKYGNVKTDHILFIASGAFHSCRPSDLLAELQGRLPIRVELKALTEQDLFRILTEPVANLLRQQVALMETEGVKLQFTEAAIKEIAHIAHEVNLTTENIGARRLHTIIERIMEEISYQGDDMAGQSVVIDGKDVKERVGELLIKTDLTRFVL